MRRIIVFVVVVALAVVIAVPAFAAANANANCIGRVAAEFNTNSTEPGAGGKVVSTDAKEFGGNGQFASRNCSNP